MGNHFYIYKLTPYIVSMTLWVPLVHEPIGPIDQSSPNMFSMANALVFDLFSKKPLAFGLWPK